MGDASLEEHIFRLSSIDYSAPHSYIRCALCYPCPSNGGDIDPITKRLTATVKRTVTHLPILAGSVRPATLDDRGQTGRLEVVVTLDNLHHFLPIIKRLSHEEFPHIYKDLDGARMPPSTFVNEKLTPLPDIPDLRCRSAVFAVQANFLSGGLIVALYLHHSVADIIGFGTVISRLSSDLPSCKLTNSALQDEAVEHSRLRDRLSGSRGVRPHMAIVHSNFEARSVESALQQLSLRSDQATCRVFSFNLNLLEEVTTLVNERFQYMHNDRETRLSCFDVIAAILWKGVSRALLLGEASDQEDVLHTTSSLLIPVNVRKAVEPQLDHSYLGNALVPAIALSGVLRLSMPFEAGTLAHTARLIHNEIAAVGEERVRSAIAGINGCSDVQSAPINRVNLATDLVITSWADLDLGQAYLGLGLGEPNWVRKLGRTQMAEGCIIHPVKREEGLCEVTVQLAEETMEALLKDENFMTFVAYVV